LERGNRIGTPVEYRRDNGSIMRTATRTRAEVLGGHTAIIWLEDVTGSIDLEWRDPRTASRDPHRVFIDDLRARHRGEDFICHYVRALDEALKDQP
jgi:hypothetical protein